MTSAVIYKKIIMKGNRISSNTLLNIESIIFTTSAVIEVEIIVEMEKKVKLPHPHA